MIRGADVMVAMQEGFREAIARATQDVEEASARFQQRYEDLVAAAKAGTWDEDMCGLADTLEHVDRVSSRGELLCLMLHRLNRGQPMLGPHVVPPAAPDVRTICFWCRSTDCRIGDAAAEDVSGRTVPYTCNRCGARWVVSGCVITPQQNGDPDLERDSFARTADVLIDHVVQEVDDLASGRR